MNVVMWYGVVEVFNGRFDLSRSIGAGPCASACKGWEGNQCKLGVGTMGTDTF